MSWTHQSCWGLKGCIVASKVWHLYYLYLRRSRHFIRPFLQLHHRQCSGVLAHQRQILIYLRDGVYERNLLLLCESPFPVQEQSIVYSRQWKWLWVWSYANSWRIFLLCLHHWKQVFVCLFMNFIAAGLLLRFSCTDMPFMCSRITADILRGAMSISRGASGPQVAVII